MSSHHECPLKRGDGPRGREGWHRERAWCEGREAQAVNTRAPEGTEAWGGGLETACQVLKCPAEEFGLDFVGKGDFEGGASGLMVVQREIEADRWRADWGGGSSRC